VAESTARTTPPKEEKMDTSSVEAPTAQALMARPRSEVLDDYTVDDDPSLMNLVTVESWIAC
jgi:hypothetical protein